MNPRRPIGRCRSVDIVAVSNARFHPYLEFVRFVARRASTLVGPLTCLDQARVFINRVRLSRD